MSASLLSPASIAIIGASKTPGKVGHAILANLVNDGFEGDIIPINPGAGEICGKKCYPSLAEYGSRIEPYSAREG